MVALRSNQGVWLRPGQRIRQTRWRPFERVFPDGSTEQRFLRETIFRETIFRETIFRETIFRETIFRETVYRETIFRETIYGSRQPCAPPRSPPIRRRCPPRRPGI